MKFILMTKLEKQAGTFFKKKYDRGFKNHLEPL